VQDAQGRLDQQHGQRRAGALAEPQPEIEQGRAPERRKRNCVAGFCRAMCHHQVTRRARRESDGSERGGAADEAVDDDRDAPGGGAEHHAGEACDFEAADASERSDRIRRRRRIALQCVAHHGGLVPQRFVVDAGATAGHAFRRRVGEQRHERARGCGVGDAHLAHADQGHAAGGELGSDRDSRLDRQLRLRASHRRSARDVARAVADPAAFDLRRARGRLTHAHVDHHDARSSQPCEHVDRGAAAREVEQHLAGDRLRVGADAFLCDAVVGAHHHDRLFRQRRLRRPVDRSQLARELLQAAEAAGGLGLRIEQGARSLGGGCVRVHDAGTGFGDSCHGACSGSCVSATGEGRSRITTPSTAR